MAEESLLLPLQKPATGPSLPQISPVSSFQIYFPKVNSNITPPPVYVLVFRVIFSLGPP